MSTILFSRNKKENKHHSSFTNQFLENITEISTGDHAYNHELYYFIFENENLI